MGVNAVLAVAHIFWTLLGTITVLPAFFDVAFVLKLDEQDRNEVLAMLIANKVIGYGGKLTTS